METHTACYIFGLVITSLALTAGHWFPGWKNLGNIGRYTIGVALIYLGLGIWLVPTGQGIIYLMAWAFPICGGVVVALCYGYDFYASIKQEVEEGKQKAFEQVIDEGD